MLVILFQQPKEYIIFLQEEVTRDFALLTAAF